MTWRDMIDLDRVAGAYAPEQARRKNSKICGGEVAYCENSCVPQQRSSRSNLKRSRHRQPFLQFSNPVRDDDCLTRYKGFGDVGPYPAMVARRRIWASTSRTALCPPMPCSGDQKDPGSRCSAATDTSP